MEIITVIYSYERKCTVQKTIILACPTLRQELQKALSLHASCSSVYFLPRQLHSDPKELHRYLQDTIDRLYNVERIVLCVSRCGGGTANLKATSAELVLPRTRDCLDILLSGSSLDALERDLHGIYFTASWMEFSKESEIDLERLTEKMGRPAAEEYLRSLYKSFHNFYIIDTGCYDVQEVRDYIAPLVRILDGRIAVLKGEFCILHKIAIGNFDDDFIRIPCGGVVPCESFLSNE